MGQRFSICANKAVADAVRQAQPRTSNTAIDRAHQPNSTQVAAEHHLDTDSESQAPVTSPAAATLSPPLRHSVVGLRAQLVDIPENVLDQLATYLPTKDVAAMAEAHSVMGRATWQRRASLRYAHNASKANTLNEMQGLLEKIRELDRPQLRTEPLLQVMQRLHALPQTDRPQALADLRSAISAPDLKSEYRPTEPPALERILSYLDAREALMNGERVDTVFSIFHMDDFSAGLLECEVIRSCRPGTAGAAMEAGGDVMSVARQFGIKYGQMSLEMVTIDSRLPGTAGAAMVAGGDAWTVSEQFQIHTPDGYNRLRTTVRGGHWW